MDRSPGDRRARRIGAEAEVANDEDNPPLLTWNLYRSPEEITALAQHNRNAADFIIRHVAERGDARSNAGDSVLSNPQVSADSQPYGTG